MSDLPIPPDLKARLDALSSAELALVAGYAWAKSQAAGTTAVPAATSAAAEKDPAAALTISAPRRVQILSASQTGNARRVAKALHERLTASGLETHHSPMGDYNAQQISDEDIVLLITSTYGDGEPPEEALPLYKLLRGKNPPRLDGVDFAVLALGDSLFPKFCQAGKDFDESLALLGARRLRDCGYCDQDYRAAAESWSKDITALLQTMLAHSGEKRPAAPDADNTAAKAMPAAYDKFDPYAARLLTRRRLTARTAEKDVEHLEIDLGDSGLRYQPGDTLGVWYENAPQLVADMLVCHQLRGEERVQIDGHEIPIAEALIRRLDITTSTPVLAQYYAQLSQNGDLQAALAAASVDEEAQTAFLRAKPPMILFRDYPHPLDAPTLARLFRPLTPRLYSIASAQAKVGEAAHLCVGVVRHRHGQAAYVGGASGFLGERLAEGEAVRIFIQDNPHFRLPADGNTPILMIGAGVGVAPFRAFMQQREADGARGENWLVFGNTRFTQDFLYHADWLKWRGDGLITRADLAWSRDRAEKVYVQHKLLEAAPDVWAYLQRGAHVYVCGDASRMAKGVEAALREIARQEGGMDEEAAEVWLETLREAGHYQRDVY